MLPLTCDVDPPVQEEPTDAQALISKINTEVVEIVASFLVISKFFLFSPLEYLRAQ